MRVGRYDKGGTGVGPGPLPVITTLVNAGDARLRHQAVALLPAANPYRRERITASNLEAGAGALLEVYTRRSPWRWTSFDEPDLVRLDRGPNRHLAVGVGIHRCLGMHLARVMTRVALEEFSTRSQTSTSPTMQKSRTIQTQMSFLD